MRKYTLLLLFMFISMNTSLNAEIIRMKNKADLLYKLVGNELYTDKESIKFLKDHILVYTNLLTGKKTIGIWAAKDSELSIRGGLTPAMCFTVEEGSGSYKGDLDAYAGGICMDLWEIPDPELHYMVGYKTWLVNRTKNNPLYTDYPEDRFRYPQSKEFSKQYFKLKYNRNLFTYHDQIKKKEKQQYEVKDKAKSYLYSIKNISDIPKATEYIRKNHLNINDYISSHFSFIKGIRNLTKSNFFNSIQYRYIFSQVKPYMHVEVKSSTFNIRFQYGYLNMRYDFNFPIICTSKAVSGGTLRTCKPSNNDMRLIKKYQKYFNKFGRADNFKKALNSAVTTTFIPKKKKHYYLPSSSTGSKTFTCTYSCISDVGLLYETYRNVGSMEISANSYSSAKNKADNIAEKRCKNTLDKHGYKMRGGSADCDFGQ